MDQPCTYCSGDKFVPSGHVCDVDPCPRCKGTGLEPPPPPSTPVEQLAELVQRMRAAQRAYFRTRGNHELVASKELERVVDREIARVLMAPGTAGGDPAQGALFSRRRRDK